MRTSHLTLFALLLAAFVSACDRTAETGPPTVETPFPMLWQVGTGDDTTITFAVLSVNDLAIDGQNRLFVIDRNGGTVAVFDSTGQLVGNWGRSGPGPGELSFPLTISAGEDGAIHVFDAEKERVVVFGADGKFRSELVATRSRPFRFRFLEGGAIVGTTSRADPKGAIRLLRDSLDAWQELESIPFGKIGVIERVCRIIGHSVDPIFHPELAWDARGTILASSTGDFAIRIRDVATRRQHDLVRDTVRRSSNRELARQSLGAGRTLQLRGDRPCIVPADQILDVAEIEPEVPAYTAIAIDPQGYIWATREVIGSEPAEADLYDLERGFVRTIQLGNARPIAFLRGNVMLSIEHDELDVPRLVAYDAQSVSR